MQRRRGHSRTLSLLAALTFPAVVLARDAGAPPASSVQPKPVFSDVSVSRVPANAASRWPGFQFVQADNKGTVYVLNGSSLEVFSLGALDGELKSRGRLKPSSGSPRVFDGAMSSSGDCWLLLGEDLHLFRRGEEVRVPSPHWAVSALAVPRDSPTVGVVPAEDGGADASRSQFDKNPPDPPLLLQLDDPDSGKWEQLVTGTYVSSDDGDPERISPMQLVKSKHDLRLSATPSGAIWLAYQNAYRLIRYSPTGKRDRTLQVGDGKVHWVERSAQDWDELEKRAKADGFQFHRDHFSPMRHQPVVRGLLAPSDSTLYAVIEVDGGLALDRYDTVEQKLQRVLLRGLPAIVGRLTLADGSDGLYIAGPLGKDGIWRVDWSLLEKAEWHDVPSATLDGQPLASSAPRAQQAKH